MALDDKIFLTLNEGFLKNNTEDELSNKLNVSMTARY